MSANCPFCGEDPDDYVNDNCPSACSDPHGEPEADHNGIWVCPETGDRYLRCDRCHDEWQSAGRYDNPVYVNGDWVCSLSDHSLSECGDCGEIVDDDEISYNHDDDPRCSDCYRGGRSSDSSGITWCGNCRESHIGFDVLNERPVCRCPGDYNSGVEVSGETIIRLFATA